MGDSNQYFLCEGAVQPIPIQKALLAAIKTDVPALDGEVADQLQSELTNLGWEKILFIVSQKAFNSIHWASLSLKIDTTVTDLNSLETTPLGSVAIYERKSDIPIQAGKDSDGQVDIILTIVDEENKSVLMVEQKLSQKSKESAFIRFKKFVSKIKNGEKSRLSTSTPKVDKDEKHFSDLLEAHSSGEEESQYDNFFTPTRRVNFDETTIRGPPNSHPPAQPRPSDTSNNSFLGHSLGCDTTRCRDRKRTTMRLNAQIDIPQFDPEEDIVDLVIEKLKLISEDLMVDSEQVIYGFCHKNGLSDMHVGLSQSQRSNLSEFAKVLRSRFGTSEASAANRFNAIRMRNGEDENDLMVRITQISNLMKRRPINAPLDKNDQFFLREKFISCLPDPTIRLLLRQMDVPPTDVIWRARSLRLAKDIENRADSSVPHQLVTLTQRVRELESAKIECEHCGRNHHSTDCRENAKGKANYNKTVNGERKPKKYVHFDEYGQNLTFPHNQNFRPSYPNYYPHNGHGGRPAYWSNFGPRNHHSNYGYFRPQNNFNHSFFIDQNYPDGPHQPYQAFYSENLPSHDTDPHPCFFQNDAPNDPFS